MDNSIYAFRKKIDKLYSIENIIKEFVTTNFKVIHTGGNQYRITPCPFSGSSTSFTIIKRIGRPDYYTRYSPNYLNEAWAKVPQRGTTYDLLTGLFYKETPMQLIQHLADYEVPKRK